MTIRLMSLPEYLLELHKGTVIGTMATLIVHEFPQPAGNTLYPPDTILGLRERLQVEVQTACPQANACVIEQYIITLQHVALVGTPVTLKG